MSTTRIAAVQMDVELGQKERNLERIAGFARQAAESGAQLVVFPECALTGYCLKSREEAVSLAESVPGPATEGVEALARELDLTIVFGLIEKADEKIHNALQLIAPEGLLASYRKIHLPHIGLDRFVEPGDGPFVVHDLPFGRLGMNICYDGNFPESARMLALAGADLIVLPTNWPEGAEVFARHLIPARAYENGVHYLAADRVGEERGFRFIGLSSIVDCRGQLLASADGTSETVLIADIDPEAARNKRLVRGPNEQGIDRLGDRRPELYGPLVAPR